MNPEHSRSRRPYPEAVSGSGSLFIEGLPSALGGAGQAIVDSRGQGFWAKITGQPNPASNAYAFARIDELPPYAAITGDAAIVGDGVGVSAFAMDGSLTVPVNAVVWLEPLRLAVGYGFTYSAGSALSAASYTNGPYDMVSVYTFENSLIALALPAPGTYLLSTSVTIGATAASLPGGGNPLTVGMQLYDVNAAAAVPFSLATCLSLQVANITQFGTTYYAPPAPYVIAGPTTIQLQLERGGPVGGITNANFNGTRMFVGSVSYRKLS